MGASQQILLGQIMADETQGTDKDSGRCSVPVKQCQARVPVGVTWLLTPGSNR